MDKNKAWEIFCTTGKVQDYLNFKSMTDAENTPLNKTDANEKNKDRWTDNKTTEYR